MTSQFFCYGGIIFFYSYYAHLQEKLIANKVLNLNVLMINIFQYSISVIIASIIILATSPKNNK